MRYHLLLLLMCTTITKISSEDKKEDVKKTIEKRNNKNIEKKTSKTEKRELLDEEYQIGFPRNLPKGSAFSYTHVVQSHGPVQKVVHIPNSVTSYSEDYNPEQIIPSSYSDDFDYNHHTPTLSSPISNEHNEYENNNHYFVPTAEPYHGPIYVTAKPVLPTKDFYGKSAATVQSDDNPALQYPLFRPAYRNLVTDQYTVPIQFVYRVPYQRNYDYQPVERSTYPITVNGQIAYTVATPLPYGLEKSYLNPSPSPEIPYSFYLNSHNNYLSYTKPDVNSEELSTNTYSDEQKRSK